MNSFSINSSSVVIGRINLSQVHREHRKKRSFNDIALKDDNEDFDQADSL